MQSKITINLNEYIDAINLSIHDDEWMNLAYKQKDNILEFAKEFSSKPEEAAAIFSTKNDISKIIKFKKNEINESYLNFFLEPFSEINKFRMLKVIKNKTKYIAENVAFALHEFCDLTNNFFEAELIPCPENIKNTTKAIDNYKVITENQEFYIKINNNKLYSNDRILNHYFEIRNNDKKIERAFTDINLESNIRDLNFCKQVEIPTNILNESGRFKVVFVENQAIKNLNSYRTIDGRNFLVKNIMRSNES